MHKFTKKKINLHTAKLSKWHFWHNGHLEHSVEIQVFFNHNSMRGNFSNFHTALCSTNSINVKLRSTLWNFIGHPIFREIKFGKICIAKIAFFTILETLKFGLWKIWDLKKCSNLLKSKFRTSKIAKNDNFWPLEVAKIWFHVKSEWR